MVPRRRARATRPARALIAFGVLLGLFLTGCDNPIDSTDPPPGGAGVLVGAGDIGKCGSPGPEATARLLDDIGGTVFTAGDNAYDHGTATDFLDCYHPSWGRHRARTRPVPGNHDHEVPGARAYFDYFGANAGPFGAGYYTYDVGSWRVYALDSEIASGPSSAQGMWLRQELNARPSQCSVAIWHRPLFSSGPNGDGRDMRELFRLLYNHGTEIVLNGHDHLYERFAPQTADGSPDPETGVVQFTVGTGGALLSNPGARKPNSEVAQSVWGVLKLTLLEDRYVWNFISARGPSFHDAGEGVCH